MRFLPLELLLTSGLSGTGAGSDTAASDEITKIAAALGLTVPASDSPVRVVTNDGKTTYSVALTYASTTTGRHAHSALITVDAAGNPAGRENLPFSVLPTAIQDGLNNGAPAGATKLATDSTQQVAVRREPVPNRISDRDHPQHGEPK